MGLGAGLGGAAIGDPELRSACRGAPRGWRCSRAGGGTPAAAHRRPVGGGPSLKTWPRWPRQREHSTCGSGRVGRCASSSMVGWHAACCPSRRHIRHAPRQGGKQGCGALAPCAGCGGWRRPAPPPPQAPPQPPPQPTPSTLCTHVRPSTQGPPPCAACRRWRYPAPPAPPPAARRRRRATRCLHGQGRGCRQLQAGRAGSGSTAAGAAQRCACLVQAQPAAAVRLEAVQPSQQPLPMHACMQLQLRQALPTHRSRTSSRWQTAPGRSRRT